MKKEITICDKCGREIHKGEKYTQRLKDLHSSRVSDMEDICRDCAIHRVNENFTAIEGIKLLNDIQDIAEALNLSEIKAMQEQKQPEINKDLWDI